MAISGIDANALQLRNYVQQQRIENQAENLKLGDKIYDARQANEIPRHGGADINYAERQRLLDITV